MLVVPNGCAPEGEASFGIPWYAVPEYLQISGAKMATNTNASVMPAPTITTTRGKRPDSRHGCSQRSGNSRMRRRRASVTDAAVDIGVDDIDEKADADDKDREKRHDALHAGIVARAEVVHQLTAQARPGEGGLGQDRATE